MQPYDESCGDYVLMPRTMQGVAGELISVRTNTGRRVEAWRPLQDEADAPSWCSCHGFTLETHDLFGYSIVSGSELRKVLTDEYRKLGTLSPSARAPALERFDLLVWWRGPDAIHSAFLESVLIDPATGKLDDRATMATSQSDSGILKPAVSLSVLNVDFRTATSIEAYR